LALRAKSGSFRLLSRLTAAAVFPLLFVGAGVTSKDAGMAFPDWPTSDGHYINPPNWLDGEQTLWEHGHRLIGWTVGLLAIATAVVGLRRGGWAARLSLGTLLAIIVQGLLGGLRIRQDSTALAMVHGIWGQACFGLACGTAMLAARSWAQESGRFQVRAVGLLRRLCVAVAVALGLQLVLGALYRHFALNGALVLHVLWAMIVALLIAWEAMWLIGQHPSSHALGRLSRAIAALIVAQLLLGGAALVPTVMGMQSTGWTAWAIPSAHVAVGALLLACSVLIAMCTFHMLREAPEQALEHGSSIVTVT